MVEVGSMICGYELTVGKPFGHRASFTSYAESDTEWEAVASNGDVDGAHELIQRLLEDPDTKSQVTRVTACV